LEGATFVIHGVSEGKQNCVDEDFHRLAWRAAVLPLVPENTVKDVWPRALEDNEDDSPNVTQFKYVTDTWVQGNLCL
jgi:hypothetical protein